MDPTNGVNPTTPAQGGYIQSTGDSGTIQTPTGSTSSSTISAPGVPEGIDATVPQQAYGRATATQDQFYPRSSSTDSRPDWQQQIMSEVNATANGSHIQPPTPVSRPNLNTTGQMYSSQNPYQMTNATPQPAPLQSLQYKEPGSTSVQSWQNSAPAYQGADQAPMGDMVIPLDGVSSGGRRWLQTFIILIVAVGLLGGIGFAGYSFGSKAGHTKASEEYKKALQQAALSQTTSDPTQRQNTEDPALDFSLVVPEYKNESVTGTVGEKLQAADGFVLYVKDVERNFKAPSSESGKELIKVNFLVGNASQTIPAKISNANFTLKTETGEVIAADDKVSEYDGKIDSLTLSSGSKGKVSVIFAVTSGANSLTFVRQQSYVSKSLGQTVVSAIEVPIGS